MHSPELLFGQTDVEEPVEDATILAPLPNSRPPMIYAIGLNYQKHVQETSKPPPVYPILISKATTSVNHPLHNIEIPTSTIMQKPEVDFEAELGVVIGKEAKNVSVEVWFFETLLLCDIQVFVTIAFTLFSGSLSRTFSC